MTSVQQYIELLWGMTEKELRVRYKYTIFGFVWIVVNPLLQMFLIGFLLSLFLKQTAEHYYYHLYAGLLIWNFFSLSLLKATPSIVTERDLIKKSMFPRSVIPISIIFSNFIHLLLGLALFAFFLIVIHMLTFQSILFISAGLCLLIIFTCGITLLTCALNVRFRDIKFLVEALLMLWFYATPIIYSFSQIPKQYIWLWKLNPLTSILQFFESGFIGTVLPNSDMIITNCLIALIIILVGFKVFSSESKNFDDWV